MSIAPPARPSGFARVLGPWSATSLVAGSMIGTGIFFFVSPVADQLTTNTEILLAWTLGGLIASCGGLCVAELAAAYPQTGGIYVYLDRAFGPGLAFLYTWTSFWITRVGNLAIAALAFSTFLLAATGHPQAASSPLYEPIALGLIAAITAVNVLGVRFGAGLQNVITLLKIASLVGILMVGAAYALGWLGAHASTVMAVAPPTRGSLARFAIALVPIMWTLGGWDESPFVAEEVEDPERNLPRSVLGGLWLVGILYIAVNGAYLAILTPAELAASGERTAVVAMERALGASGQRTISLMLMIASAGMANGMALTGARLAFATGRNQRMFTWLATTHPRTKTPARALIVQALLVVVTIMLIPDPYLLLLYTALSYWLFALLMAAALLVLRLREPERRRPFRVWGYPLTPLLFIAVSTGMAASVVQQSLYHAGATVVIWLVGLLVFALQRGGGGSSAAAGERKLAVR